MLRQGWETMPAADRHGYTDLYGNDCQRLTLPVGDTTLRYDALVDVPDATEDVDLDAAEMPAAQLPDDVLVYTLPSRYCLPDVLGDEAWRLFGSEKPGYRRVQAICDHVHGHLRFAYGSSTPIDHRGGRVRRRPAASAATSPTWRSASAGRCRSRPATPSATSPTWTSRRRPEPMDFAAWMEVYLDGRWWTFDPRNNAARKGRVLIGRGRDAVDVAMVTTYGGPVLQSMQVWAEETT